jgi:hypothetical protein
MSSLTYVDKTPHTVTSSDIVAMASIIVSLVYPAALLLNAIGVVFYSFTVGSSRPFPWLGLIYTVIDYAAAPVILAAIILGHLALIRAHTWRRLAKTGILIGYVSLAELVLAFVVVVGVSALSSH